MLFRILILLFILLIAPDVYIYFVYMRRLVRNRWLRLLAFVPSVLLLVYMMVVLSIDDMRPEHQSAVGIFMLVFLAICVPKMFFLLVDGLAHAVSLINQRFAVVRRVGRIVAMSLGLFSFIILLYGYFIGRNRYVVHQQTVYFDNLPQKFDGYRIAQFSDMHIGTLNDGHQQDARTIVNLINSQQCDAILFCGDLVNHQSSELDGFEDVLSRLRARDGVYSVMGNHDYSMYIKYGDKAEQEADVKRLQQRVRKMGWHLLLNEHAIIHRDSDSIAIVGVENEGKPPFPQLADLNKAMQGLPKNIFSVLISHDPTHWRKKILPETRIPLTLSGHTHAGQIKVFGWSPVSFVYDEWSGLYGEGTQVINVSNGVGGVMFPFRFGAWPEINVITLKKTYVEN